MLHELRELTYRPARSPGIMAPVTARSTGHYRLVRRTESNDPRPFTQVFWVSGGKAVYRRGGRAHACGPGEVFFYTANEPHHVAPAEEWAEYYWATFDGGLVGEWLEGVAPGPGPRLAGPCPVALFEELRACVGRPSVADEKRAAVLGLQLLMAFVDAPGAAQAEEPSREELLCRAVEKLIGERFRDSGFGIEAAAAELALHRSTLFRVYRARRGITPSAYLQRQRLQHGLELLRQGPCSITDAALASGFRDANYFAKVIRRATGEPPRRVRRALAQ